jgi:tetratricopeptide (TPR) repeat protein
MNNNKFKLNSSRLLIVGLIFLMLASESVYLLGSGQKGKIFLYLSIAKFESKQKNLDKAFSQLEKLNRLRVKELKEIYPSKNITTDPINMPVSQSLKDETVDFIKTIDPFSFTKDYYYQLSVFYYKLGLIASKADETETAKSYFKLAARLAPEWSYFSIELANLLLINDDRLGSKKVIEECKTYQFPRDFCTNYEQENLNLNNPSLVGFLEETINDFGK